MTSFLKKLLAFTLLFFIGFSLGFVEPSYAASSPADQRAAIDKMEGDVLNKLYEVHPAARAEMSSAVGYAVFSSGSLALIWVGGSYGHGVAHKNGAGKIYMKMASAGVGIGLGAKDYNTVFIFHDAKVLDDFVTQGLDLTGHADASAKVNEKGDAVGGSGDILRGVRIYQLTDTGLMAQLMLQGTKYWPDKDLNAAP